MLPPFAVERPADLADALTMLSEDCIPYCGGTELLLAMKMGLLRPDALVDLKRLTELRGMRVDDQEFVIGAATSHADIARSTLVSERLPLLAKVERRVGNARVRSQGSIGGNLCFAEPRSDIATVLLALNARLSLASTGSTRRVAMADFIDGAYSTARAASELLVDVRIPLPAPSGAYEKFQTAERPTVGVAVVRGLQGGVRIVLGAVGEMPLAFEFADLSGVEPEAIADGIDPIPDLTGSVRYKKHVTATYIRRVLALLETVKTDG
ncbi:MAG: FAD binding domain-containing protein [Acidothermaceae bacterium]